MQAGRAAGLVALLTLLAGCASLVPGRHGDVQRELNRSRALWRSQGVASYEYVVRRLCYCTMETIAPVRVRVHDGRVAQRSYVEGGAPDPRQAELWPAVEGLFDVIQDAIDRDAHSITVDYHPQLGYPTSIQIDYEANVADEELGFTAGELVPLR